jgi:ubiquinone/menaquinone biosynthesis C-methylase UbiE
MEILKREFDKEKTKNNYKKVAGVYNFWSWLTESKAAKEVLRLADIKDNQQILEVACGTGVLFEKIVRLNPNGLCTGVDLSPEMLGIAKKRVGKLKNLNYTLREGNILNPDFPNDSFDIVINNFMIDLMPEETFDKIAEVFFKVLKQNGIAVISIFSFGEKKINKFWVWIAKRFPDLLTGCRPVSFSKNLINAGFIIESETEISQNTFPSSVIKARKLNT